MRLLVRRIHLILSLTAGLWLAVSGLSGALLVFGDRLDRTLHPDLFRLRGTASADLGAVAAAAERAAGGTATRIRLASEASPVHEVWIDCDHCLRVWIDPSTAIVNGVTESTGTTRGFLHELHRRMLSGETGETLVGVGGIALVLLSLSGLWLFWPRGSWRAALRFVFRRGWKKANYDLHRLAGLLAIPWFLVSGLTGIYFVFHEPFDAMARAMDRAPAPPVTPAILATAAPQPLADLVERATRLFPRARVTWLTLPENEGTPLFVRLRQEGEWHPNGRTFVRVDPYHGTVVGIVDGLAAPPAKGFLDRLYPIHIGVAGGTPHRVLLSMVGFLPAILTVTGLLAWWNRSLRRKVGVRG